MILTNLFILSITITASTSLSPYHITKKNSYFLAVRGGGSDEEDEYSSYYDPQKESDIDSPPPPPPPRPRPPPRSKHPQKRSTTTSTAFSLASKTANLATSLATSSIQTTINLASPKHVTQNNITGLWRLDQQVGDTYCSANIQLHNDGTLTTYSSDQSCFKSKYQFQERPWPRYCTIRFQAKCFQRPEMETTEPTNMLYKGWFQRKVMDPNVIYMKGKIYGLEKSWGRVKEVEVGRFRGRKRLSCVEEENEDDVLEREEYDYDEEYEDEEGDYDDHQQREYMDEESENDYDEDEYDYDEEE